MRCAVACAGGTSLRGVVLRRHATELRRTAQRILRVRPTGGANAVRTAARKLQIIRAIHGQRRHSRFVGRRHRSNHLRNASDRVSSDAIFSRPFFPHQITREFTFLPYAQISEFTLVRPRARHRSVLRAARAQARSRRQLRRRRYAVQSGRGDPSKSRCFRGRCSSASGFTASPNTKCARSVRRRLHLFEKSADGRGALVGRLARTARGNRRFARADHAASHAHGIASSSKSISTK